MDSDPDIEFIEKDSGMSSLGGSKDETPERRTVALEPDESFGERILGLTEMFPESVRNVVGAVSSATVKSCRGLYQFSCSASWIFFTSSVILFAPVIFETERAQMEELHKSQQKQVLLGPGSAMAPSGPSPSLPLIR
ncbi:hypothetical protein KR215_011575 [Drosophila sulfurigaster]|nr:hypothetical protein KR215_011789 [Drosophila sulfurigaster]KAH8413926.1 hypothetical protein KR215_011575 [Drosophila sulfurigaster]